MRATSTLRRCLGSSTPSLPFGRPPIWCSSRLRSACCFPGANPDSLPRNAARAVFTTEGTSEYTENSGCFHYGSLAQGFFSVHSVPSVVKSLCILLLREIDLAANRYGRSSRRKSAAPLEPAAVESVNSRSLLMRAWSPGPRVSPLSFRLPPITKMYARRSLARR